jgi:hypothetical protein
MAQPLGESLARLEDRMKQRLAQQLFLAVLDHLGVNSSSPQFGAKPASELRDLVEGRGPTRVGDLALCIELVSHQRQSFGQRVAQGVESWLILQMPPRRHCLVDKGDQPIAGVVIVLAVGQGRVEAVAFVRRVGMDVLIRSCASNLPISEFVSPGHDVCASTSQTT